jgi:hypothetical protein
MRKTAQNPAEGLPGRLPESLEHAAGAIARLDSAVARHPLAPAWAWRARLDAVRRQAAVDGQAIDPWHLAALIEGVRFRLDRAPALIDRGTLFAAAHHAFELYRWFSGPDQAQQAAIAAAAAHLEAVGEEHPPLLGAAFGVHAWLDRGGEREPLRAALAMYWQRRGLTALPCPLLTGSRALRGEVPWTRNQWIGHFLDALAEEAEDGIALMVTLEHQWFARAPRLPDGAAIRAPPRRSTSWRRPRSSPPRRSARRSAWRSKTPPACSKGSSCSVSPAR